LIGLGDLMSPNVIEVTPSLEKVFQVSFNEAPSNFRSIRAVFPQQLSVMRLPIAANDFEIRSIYPDPARTSVQVSFSLMNAGMVKIDLINMLGSAMNSSSQYISDKGAYCMTLDVRNLPNGVYCCKCTQNGNSMTKMLLVQK